MGGMGYWKQEARESLLGEIVRHKSKYLISLVGIKENKNEMVEGAYKLLEELNELEIRAYAKSIAIENGVKLIKINIYSLEQPKLERELTV